MAIILSNLLTDMDNKTIVDAGKAVGNVLVATAVVDLITEPSENDLLMFCDLPSNCRLKNLVFYNEDLDSGGNAARVFIGIYAGGQFVKADGTTVLKNEAVSTQAFAFNDNLLTQNNTGQDFRFNTNGDAFTLNSIGYGNAQFLLWELAALEQDPLVPLRIGFNLEDAFDVFVPGKLMLQAFFTFKA